MTTEKIKSDLSVIDSALWQLGKDVTARRDKNETQRIRGLLTDLYNSITATPPIAGIKEAIEAYVKSTTKNDTYVEYLTKAAYFGASLPQKHVDWDVLEQDLCATFGYGGVHNKAIIGFFKSRLQGVRVEHEKPLGSGTVKCICNNQVQVDNCDLNCDMHKGEQGEVMSAEVSKILDYMLKEPLLFFEHDHWSVAGTQYTSKELCEFIISKINKNE